MFTVDETFLHILRRNVYRIRADPLASVILLYGIELNLRPCCIIYEIDVKLFLRVGLVNYTYILAALIDTIRAVKSRRDTVLSEVSMVTVQYLDRLYAIGLRVLKLTVHSAVYDCGFAFLARVSRTERENDSGSLDRCLFGCGLDFCRFNRLGLLNSFVIRKDRKCRGNAKRGTDEHTCYSGKLFHS